MGAPRGGSSCRGHLGGGGGDLIPGHLVAKCCRKCPPRRLDHPAPRSEHISEMSPPPVTHKKGNFGPKTGYLPRRIKLASFQAPTKSQKFQENEFKLGLPSINFAHRAVSDQLALHLIPLLPAQCYALLHQPRQHGRRRSLLVQLHSPGGLYGRHSRKRLYPAWPYSLSTATQPSSPYKKSTENSTLNHKSSTLKPTPYSYGLGFSVYEP